MANMERLERAKRELERMAEMPGQIIDGNMTQSQMAKQLGITPQSLNHELNVGCFSNYLRKKDILTEKDILKCMIDAETPCEKIVRDIFGITDKEKILFIEPELQEEFIKEMKKTLTEEQWRIISLRYGFEYLEADKDAIEKVSKKCPDFSVKRMRYFLYEPKNANLPVHLREMKLKDAKFSTKTYNALNRTGIHTVGDLVQYTKKDLMKIRQFGTGGLSEVEKFLEEHDLQLAD